MNFETEKYEYLLHTWGGFYNEEHKAKHGLEPGYFWFSTADERKKFLDNLKEAEKKYEAHYLASSFEEGKYVRYRTVARMKLVYKGKEYPYEYDFGFGYPVDSAHYMWEDGNYSCDCNKSLFLSRVHEEVSELDCGDTIETRDFIVTQERTSCAQDSAPEEAVEARFTDSQQPQAKTGEVDFGK